MRFTGWNATENHDREPRGMGCYADVIPKNGSCSWTSPFRVWFLEGHGVRSSFRGVHLESQPFHLGTQNNDVLLMKDRGSGYTNHLPGIVVKNISHQSTTHWKIRTSSRVPIASRNHPQLVAFVQQHCGRSVYLGKASRPTVAPEEPTKHACWATASGTDNQFLYTCSPLSVDAEHTPNPTPAFFWTHLGGRKSPCSWTNRLWSPHRRSLLGPQLVWSSSHLKPGQCCCPSPFLRLI